MSHEPARGTPEARYPFTPYPRGWFRVAYANEIAPGEVKRLHFFGKELVAFRGESGGPAQVFDAFCPHLGAHLGVGGSVEGDTLRCPFHHWRYDQTGKCVDVPYAKRIPDKARLVRWPTEERNGLVLVWHDRDGGEPTFQLPELPELSDPEFLPLDVSKWSVNANWLDMNENCVDKVHFRYIHGTLNIPPTTAKIEDHVHIATSLFNMRVPDGEAEATLITSDYGPGFQTVYISGLIDTLMMNTSTPIDDECTDVSFAYTVRAQEGSRESRLAEAVVKDLRNQFENDRPIWENKVCWSRPVLCDGDGPIGTYRKWYQQFI